MDDFLMLKVCWDDDYVFKPIWLPFVLILSILSLNYQEKARLIIWNLERAHIIPYNTMLYLPLV